MSKIAALILLRRWKQKEKNLKTEENAKTKDKMQKWQFQIALSRQKFKGEFYARYGQQ